MRALVFEAPAPDATRSRVVEIAVPEPGPGQVSIDVRHAGVNFKDIMARRGDPGYAMHWPFVPGLEIAGTVRSLGRGVSDLEVGQVVAAFTGAGGLAEVAVAECALVVPVPDEVTLEVAAATPGALVTATLLLEDLGRLRPGDTVLLHGASGGVGQAVARLARAAGAGLVLGTVGNEARIESALELGYDQVLARGHTVAEAVLEAAGGRGADVILDPQGTTLLDVDLAVAAPGARIILFGNATGAPLDPLPPLERLLAGNLSLGGFSLAALAKTAPERVAVALRAVLDRLAAGELAFRVTTVLGLERAPAAHEALAEGRARHKQIVSITPEALRGTARQGSTDGFLARSGR
jgi:NADPH2:quinone reductase